MEIRGLKKTDSILSVSKVYEESWKHTYNKIIPKDYLESIKEGQWAAGIWQDGRKNLIIIENGVIIGTSCFGRPRINEMAGFGEIISIYLLPGYTGKGYGKLLLNAVIASMAEEGYGKVFLWVLEENHNARRFYERYGFVESGRNLTANIGGKKLKECQYCYIINWQESK